MVSQPKSFGFIGMTPVAHPVRAVEADGLTFRVGLGNMGYPMCTHIRAKIPGSAPLYIFDLNTKVLEKFVETNKGKGEIIIAKSPRDVVEHVDLLITILPEGKHVKSVYFTPETGILAAQGRKDMIFIDSS